jgi:anaerobic magnesium-protoporphyrin IX monomethyl ester cyclase
MRIAFCYPPYTQKGRYPTLPQNRQFVYTSSKAVKIYPVVMATAATWLFQKGHMVLWLDGISRRLSRADYEKGLLSGKPDLVVLESKTPIMAKLWREIEWLKSKLPEAKVAVVGDHVSFFPEETLRSSQTDYVLTGGDYDFQLVSLVEHLTGRGKPEGGIYWQEKGRIRNSGEVKLDHDLSEVPLLDRQLTRWADYGEAYLFHPVGYIMSGRGCGIDLTRNGSCTFCVWQQGLWRCQARISSPKHVLAEVKNLVSLGAKEIFDDAESGALWNTEWLGEFYDLLKKEKLLGKVSFSSNGRADQLNPETCRLLKKSGYRLLKVGLESGNDETLAKIGKKENLKQIITGVKNAKDAGLRVMLTMMVGYPWETENEVRRTYEVARELMLYKTRAGDCLQASVIVPYPGTPFWRQAAKEKWFAINPDDYEAYDMNKPVLKSKIDASYWCRRIWSIQKEPVYVIKSGLSIRSLDELFLLVRGARSLLGHARDYGETD